MLPHPPAAPWLSPWAAHQNQTSHTLYPTPKIIIVINNTIPHIFHHHRLRDLGARDTYLTSTQSGSLALSRAWVGVLGSRLASGSDLELELGVRLCRGGRGVRELLFLVDGLQGVGVWLVLLFWCALILVPVVWQWWRLRFLDGIAEALIRPSWSIDCRCRRGLDR